MKVSILAGILAAGALGAAATPPPPGPFDSMNWKPTAKSKPATGIKMGAFEVKWEETTLDSLVRAAGGGQIQHQGDAGESHYWLCFTIEGTNAHRLWVIAHGEMGGPEHVITNITVEALKDAKAKKDCPPLPAKLQPVALSQGLWVGAKEVDARKLLGSPSHSEGPWRSFDHLSKVPGACEGGFDRMNWVLYRVHERQLVTIMAGQVTSC